MKLRLPFVVRFVFAAFGARGAWVDDFSAVKDRTRRLLDRFSIRSEALPEQSASS